jgi:UDP-GlcNAc:undecaprenyl-phosphate GlcNAc-1-phosphate transferase
VHLAAQQFFVVVSAAFLAALVCTPVVARLAVRWGWLDHPDGRRKLHRQPVPTVGGVAVVAAFSLAAVQLEFVARRMAGVEALPPIWRPLVASALVLMLLGLVDDARGVKPFTKLIVQGAVATYLWSGGFRIVTLSNPFGSEIHLGALGLPVTLVWLVGMSNAFNLIDGLDGLAAGLSLVSTVGLCAAALVNGRFEIALVALALAGALAGFLPYNFNPARIFLGDCGALPVGLILGAIALYGSIKASAAIVISIPLLALALPILDVLLALVRRFVRRKPVFEGDHDHIHHRLVEMGLTPRRAVVTLYAVATLFMVLALASALGPWTVVWASITVALLVIGLGVRALGYWEVTEIQKSLMSRVLSGLRASGDAALRGLEHEVERTPAFEDTWAHICATAWSLGFTEMHLVPRKEGGGRLRERHDRQHRPDLRPAAAHGELEPVVEATWRIEVMAGGAIVAEVTARRPLQPFDFDPQRFAAIVQKAVAREAAGAPASATAAAAVSPAGEAGSAPPDLEEGTARQVERASGSRAPADASLLQG